VKLHDFGLWFKYEVCRDGEVESECEVRWSTDIPPLPPRPSSYVDGWYSACFFEIFYDGVEVGYQCGDFNLCLYPGDKFIMKLKNNFQVNKDCYEVGRRLTLDDFEVIPNPDYKGAV